MANKTHVERWTQTKENDAVAFLKSQLRRMKRTDTSTLEAFVGMRNGFEEWVSINSTTERIMHKSRIVKPRPK